MAVISYALLLSLLGAAILIDKWAFGEFGLSQPIISCPLVGLILGDFNTGLFLGAALQLVWVEALPLGSGRPLDYQSAGVVGITCYFFARKIWGLGIGGQGAGVGSWAPVENRFLLACIVLGALATILGQFADDQVKRFNRVLFEAGMRARTRWGVTGAHLLGLIPSFLRGLVVVAVFLAALWAVRSYVPKLPDFTPGELLVIPLSIGIAGLVKLFLRRKRIPLMLAGAVLAVIIWAFWK